MRKRMSARQPVTTSVPAMQFGSPSQFFDLSDPSVADLFAGCEYVWDSLKRLKEIVRSMVSDVTVVHGTVMAGAYVAPTQVRVSSLVRSSTDRVTSAREPRYGTVLTSVAR